MLFATTRLSLILFGLSLLLKYKARRHEAFWKRVKERNFVAQIMTRDDARCALQKLDAAQDLLPVARVFAHPDPLVLRQLGRLA